MARESGTLKSDRTSKAQHRGVAGVVGKRSKKRTGKKETQGWLIRAGKRKGTKLGKSLTHKKSFGSFTLTTTDPEGHPIVRIHTVDLIERLEGLGFLRPVPMSRAKPTFLKTLESYTDDEIYSLVVPKRTLARRESKNEPLTIEETDKALRLARVASFAEKVFGDAEKARRWLRKPKRSLEGETPLLYLASESGARVVEEMLVQIDSGIVP